jgi:hypothetical protein
MDSALQVDGEAGYTPVDTRPVSRRLGVWQIVSLAIVVALAVSFAYYGIRLAQSSAFNDERAFRVLANIAEQIGQLQSSRVSVLQFMPSDAKDGFKASRNANEQQLRARRSYLAKLDLVNQKICWAPARSSVSEQQPQCRSVPSVPDENTLLNFSPEGRDFKMAVRWCDRDDCFEVSEPFGSAADHFVAQDFFDEALVARPSGVVLAEFPRHEEPGSKDVELHSSTAETLNILNVGHFLKRSRNSAGEATRAQSTEAAPGKPDGAER